MCHGILLLDKPTGYSSNAVLQKIRRLCGGVKAGHAGTLDPLATGILPILLGDATRFSSFLLEADKAYQVSGRLGQRTDSADSEGTLIASSEAQVSYSDLFAVIAAHFLGNIKQTPPVLSAIKVEGLAAYKWKRQKGIEPCLSSRSVCIRSIDILDFSYPFFSLEVRCTKGTYIRSLIDDIGLFLGCYAHVVALRRIQTGRFFIEDAYSLEQLAHLDMSSILRKVEVLFLEWPEYTLPLSDLLKLAQGAPVVLPNTYANGQCVRLYYNELFIGIASIDNHDLVKRVLLRSQLIRYIPPHGK